MPARILGQGTELAFDDFAPDKAITSPGILLDLHEAVPTTKGYKSRNAAAQYAPALASTPLGGYVALYADRTVSVLAGTATDLYRYSGSAWTSIGSGFTATYPWVFAQFGDDVIATNAGVTNMQVAAGAGGSFGNLGGSPPSNAVSAISVAGFMAAYKANQWFNSSAGTDTGWPANVQTQSGSGFLYDLPGNIVAAAPFFRNQIVWKQQAMWMLSYVGGTQVWASQLLSVNTGTWGQGCVCLMPTAIAFLGTDDFYISQGYAPTRIPNNLKEWFFANVSKDSSGNPNYLHKTSSWYDPTDAVAYWHYVSNQAPYAGVPDQYVGWNSRVNRWTHGYLSTPLVIWNTQPGLSAGLYFDTDNVLQSWTGTPGTSAFLTGYMGNADSLSQLQKVRFTYSTYPTSQNCTPLSAYILGQAPTAGAPATLGQDGWFNTRQTNRYHQVRLGTFGACEVMGYAFEARVSGVR